MEKIVCSQDCTHSLVPLASLSDPFIPSTASMSQIYCISGSRKATEAEVILNSLNRPFLGSTNLEDIWICPNQKIQIFRSRKRKRTDRKERCQLCGSTCEVKKVTIMRSAYFQESGFEVRAEDMVCRKCVSKHKQNFQVWTANYLESQVKVRNSKDIGGNTEIETDAEMNTISSKGDHLLETAILREKNSNEMPTSPVLDGRNDGGGKPISPLLNDMNHTKSKPTSTVLGDKIITKSKPTSLVQCGNNNEKSQPSSSQLCTKSKLTSPMHYDENDVENQTFQQLYDKMLCDKKSAKNQPVSSQLSDKIVIKSKPASSLLCDKNVTTSKPTSPMLCNKNVAKNQPESYQLCDKNVIKRKPVSSLLCEDNVIKNKPSLSVLRPKSKPTSPVLCDMNNAKSQPASSLLCDKNDTKKKVASPVFCDKDGFKDKLSPISEKNEENSKPMGQLNSCVQDLEDLFESPLMSSVKLGKPQTTLPAFESASGHIDDIEVSHIKPSQGSQESTCSPKNSQEILEDLSSSCSQPSADSDEDYRDIDIENKEKFELLQNFFKTISNEELNINYKWKSEKVSDRVERGRCKILNDMVHTLLETIFPEGNESDYQRIIDGAFRTKNDDTNPLVLEKIIEAYTNTKSTQVKKFLVMELTLLKKFQELKELLPGLTMYQYKEAKKQVKESGLSKLPDLGYQNVTRNRRDMDSTVHWLEFFVGHIKDVSHGASKVELSTGESLTCQNAVLEVLVEVIIRMYEIQYEEDREKYEAETTLPFPIKKLGKTTLRKLAKTVPLGALKSLRGLDYYAASGSEACDSLLDDLENKVLPRGTCPEEINQIKDLIVSLKESQRHLKTEFKHELSTASNVARHCTTWALSDPNIKEFSTSCDHEHNAFCTECEVRASSLQAVKKLVDKLFPSDSFEDRETRFETMENINYINDWEQHEVRGFHQNQKEQKVLEKLDDPRKGYLTHDLAMKWLSRKFREPMDAWFAQRGLSWQVVLHWFKSEPNGEIEIQAYVQVYGAEKQDSYANYSCLEYTLAEIMKRHPEIDSLALSSDNAGNYHNNNALLSYIPRLAQKFNLLNVSYDFKEPQKGKGPVDARIAQMKKNMLVFLNAGNDVSTPLEMKKAIDAFTGVKGTTVSVVEVNRANEAVMKSPKNISGITKLFSFTYERVDDEYWVRYRQHSDIGTGKVLKIGRVDSSPFAPVIIAPYSSSGDSYKTLVIKNHERARKGLLKAFPCPDCVLSFDSLNLLVEHVDSGNHKKITDIENQDDRTKVLFVDYINKGRVATLNFQKNLPNEAVTGQNLPQGWSLKKREKGGLLPEPAKKVLRELYESGKLTKKKITPEEGSKILRRKFPNDEIMWLKASQVKSQFSAMTKADKVTDGFDADDVEAVEERRLLQVPLEALVAEMD